MEVAQAAVERLWPGKQASIAELGGGITNRNFKVDVEDGSFVLRLGGARTSLLGIDREVECEAGERAFEVGVGPEVIAFLPEEAWLVTRYVNGRSIAIDEMSRPETLSRLAAAFRRFHEAPEIPGRFDSFRLVDDYRARAEEHGVQVPDEFEDARAVAGLIAARLGERPLVPCHNDLVNGNFLDDGEVRIVDWEYAGMGDPFFDLATFSANHEFEIEDDRRLLAAYFGEARDADLEEVRLLRFMSDFREAMWGVLQAGISDLDFDFMSHARKHFARLEETAAQLNLGT